MATLLKAESPLHCRLFGVFSIEGRQGPVRIRSRRARALVAYLALAGAEGVTRERLSGLLWTDRGDEQARASLRQCLLELRRELAEAGIEALDVDRERVALVPGSLVSDVAELEAAIAGEDGAVLASGLRSIGGKALLEDLSLGGLYDAWLARTRSEFDNTLERAVRRRVEAAEAGRAWDELRDIAEAFLLRAPADEVVVAAAIRADMALGVTSSAHRRFRALESTLAQEYGVQPGASVSRALASPEARPPAPDTAAPASPAPAGHATPIVVVGAVEGAEANDGARALGEIVRDEVVSGLSRFRDLSVVTDPHPASSLDAAAFADPQFVFTLGARVRPAGRPGITLQLMRLHTRTVVWSDSFDMPDAEILNATDMIVARVVGAVLPSIDLDLAGAHHEAKAGGSYLRYLRANRLSATAATYEEAQRAAEELEDLIRIHPRFVLPYLPLARIYNTDFNFTVAGSSDAARFDRGLELARKAISIDRGHIHGYVVTAWSYLRNREWEPALQLFEQALNLNPFNASRLKEIGFGLLFLDQRDRARELLNRCLLVNPTPEDGYFTDLALLEMICGAGERAATYFALVAEPTIWSLVYNAVNAELSGRGGGGISQRARQRIAAIWPADRDSSPDAVIAWMLVHNPFRSEEVQDRFVTGARMMLGPAASLTAPAPPGPR